MGKKKKEEETVEEKIIKDYRLDFPTDEDLLGFSDYAESIINIIEKSKDKRTSLTIGIFGQWGTGKSSFLNIIEKKLNPNVKKLNYTTIFFNAWKYENEENLLAALMQLILNQVNNKSCILSRFLLRFRIACRKILWKQGLWKFLLMILKILFFICFFIFLAYVLYSPNIIDIKIFTKNLFTTGITILLLLIRLNPKIFEKILDVKFDINLSEFISNDSFTEHVSLMEKFRTEFVKVIKIISPKKPIIVFIDDLDRCFPEKTIKLLEIIKTFLDIENIVFIIAVDPVIIEKIIRFKYIDLKKVNDDNEIDETFSGKDYFEKIIQLPISIPVISKHDVENLILNLYPELKSTNIVSLIHNCFPRNPRKIKRILYLFEYYKNVYMEKNKEKIISEVLLLKLLIIQDQYKELYKQILVNNSLLLDIQLFYSLHEEFENKNNFSESDKNALRREFMSEELIADLINIHTTFDIEYIFKYKNDDNDLFSDSNINESIYLLKTFVDFSDNKSKKPHKFYFEKELKNFYQINNLKINNKREKITLESEFYKISPQEDGKKRYNIEEIIKENNKNIILGDFGSGKTTAVENLFSLISSKINDISNIDLKNNLYYPIIIDCKKIQKSQSIFLSLQMDSIDDFIKTTNVLQILNKVEQKVFESIIRNGRCLFLVDGINDLHNIDLRKKVINLFNNLYKKYPENKLILTSRTNIYETEGFENWVFYNIISLTIDEINNYIDKLKDNIDKIRLKEMIQGVLEYKNLGNSIPLFIDICINFLQNEEKLNDIWNERRMTKYQLYYLIEKNINEGNSVKYLQIEISTIHKMFKAIAYSIKSQPYHSITRSDIKDICRNYPQNKVIFVLDKTVDYLINGFEILEEFNKEYIRFKDDHIYNYYLEN